MWSWKYTSKDVTLIIWFFSEYFWNFSIACIGIWFIVHLVIFVANTPFTQNTILWLWWNILYIFLFFSGCTNFCHFWQMFKIQTLLHNKNIQYQHFTNILFWIANLLNLLHSHLIKLYVLCHECFRKKLLEWII